MGAGETIINEIIRQGMVTCKYPELPPDVEGYLFVWSANAAEQLDALVEDIIRKRTNVGGCVLCGKPVTGDRLYCDHHIAQRRASIGL